MMPRTVIVSFWLWPLVSLALGLWRGVWWPLAGWIIVLIALVVAAIWTGRMYFGPDSDDL